MPRTLEHLKYEDKITILRCIQDEEGYPYALDAIPEQAEVRSVDDRYLYVAVPGVHGVVRFSRHTGVQYRCGKMRGEHLRIHMRHARL